MFKKNKEINKGVGESKKEINKKKNICACPTNNLKWVFLFIIVVVVIGILVSYIINNQQQTRIKTEMADKLKTFIGNYLINEGQNIELINIEEISGLYRMNFKIEGNPIKLYMTKDGKFLIFEGGIRNFVEFKTEIKGAEERAREEREWREKSDQFQAALTPERKEKIAKCLTERGFKVYFAEWCPRCRQQKELFGEAAKYLTYIDCVDPDGVEGNLAKCPHLQGVPAWRSADADKIVHNGLACIKRLVKLSGCDY